MDNEKEYLLAENERLIDKLSQKDMQIKNLSEINKTMYTAYQAQSKRMHALEDSLRALFA